MDFIVLNLEYDSTAPTPPCCLGQLVLQAHPNRRAIVVSHYLMNPGSLTEASARRDRPIYDALKRNANLFLMLTGHVPCQEGIRQDTFQGNTITTLLSNYQERANGGNGWLRIYQFSPSNNEIRARTYSPWLQAYESDADSEFAINYNMAASSDDFAAIGTVTVSVWRKRRPGLE